MEKYVSIECRRDSLAKIILREPEQNPAKSWDLTEAEVDYAGLVDAIFAAEHVWTW